MHAKVPKQAEEGVEDAADYQLVDDPILGFPNFQRCPRPPNPEYVETWGLGLAMPMYTRHVTDRLHLNNMDRGYIKGIYIQRFRYSNVLKSKKCKQKVCRARQTESKFRITASGLHLVMR